MSIDSIPSLPLDPLLEWLQKSCYGLAGRVPAFPTRRVCPLQDLWVETRLRQGRPIPLAAHSRPGRFERTLPAPTRAAYRLFYLHEEGEDAPELPGWLESGSLGMRARWQVAPVQDTFIVSSIHGRSPGEFIYLGDDSGLLIERARQLLGPRASGRACDMACGCGVVGLNLPPGFTQVVGLDAVPEAIALARLNSALNPNRPTHYLVSDLWAQAEGQFDFVIGNPPALPLQGELRRLKFAFGGDDPAHLTLGVVAGLRRHLAPGGVCLLLTFSVRDQLWHQLQPLLGSEFSLSYRPRRRIHLQDPQLEWMDHLWLEIRRDGRGRRQFHPPSLWDRACQWSWPGLRAEPPRQRAYAGNQRSPS